MGKARAILNGRLNKVSTKGDLPKMEVSNLRLPLIDFGLGDLVRRSSLPGSMIGRKKSFSTTRSPMKTTSFLERRIRLDPFFPRGYRFLLTVPERRDLRRDCLRQFFLLGLIDWGSSTHFTTPVVSGERIMFGFESASKTLLGFGAKAWSES